MSRTTVSHTATAPASSPTASLLASPVSRRAALTALLLPLAACTAGSEEADAPADDPADDPSEAPADAAPEAAADPAALTVTDPWVKAAEEGMTSGFGTLVNGTSQDLVLIRARTAASAHVELHETTDDGSGGMSMQEKEGGFSLPAGAELLLEPGGNHLMLMELTSSLRPGDEVELILEFGDGTELPFTAAVKDFAGAQEHYEPEGSTGSGASDGGGDAGHDAGKDSGHASEHDTEHDAGHGGEE